MMRRTLDSVWTTARLPFRRHFVIFGIIIAFTLAQLTWWVTFQVMEGRRVRAIQEDQWQQQIAIAGIELERRADRSTFGAWLAQTFPDIELSGNGTITVRSNARSDLDELAGRRVRMFIAEGTFFCILLLSAVFYMYRILQDELANEQRQNVFLAATSHELKTPITALRLYLDTMLERKLGEEKRTELLQTMQRELGSLNDLIDRLLLAQAIVSPEKSFRISLLNISEETELVAAEYAHRLPAEKYPFQHQITEGLMAVADPERWGMLVRNLLDNAVKYSPNGGPIELTLTQSKDTIFLKILDRGVGFDSTEAERIFGRFYRIGDESTRNTKGTGLGLYLVREIAKSFGGRAYANSAGPGLGALFTVELPAEGRTHLA